MLDKQKQNLYSKFKVSIFSTNSPPTQLIPTLIQLNLQFQILYKTKNT